MKKLFMILSMCLLFSCHSGYGSQKTTFIQGNHPNYCLLANSNVDAPQGPIYCPTDTALDDQCVTNARQAFKAAVKGIYTNACTIAAQLQTDLNNALALCGDTQSCINNANRTYDKNMTNLDNQVTASIAEATASYWNAASNCCIPD